MFQKVVSTHLWNAPDATFTNKRLLKGDFFHTIGCHALGVCWNNLSIFGWMIPEFSPVDTTCRSPWEGYWLWSLGVPWSRGLKWSILGWVVVLVVVPGPGPVPGVGVGVGWWWSWCRRCRFQNFLGLRIGGGRWLGCSMLIIHKWLVVGADLSEQSGWSPSISGT